MRDEVTNIRGFLIKLTSLHLPPTPHPPCTTMGEYDDNLLSLTYRSNLVKVCKQFVQSNNQFFCSTFRWEFGKSNNIREQNAEKDKRRKLEGVSIAQIVFTRQTGRDYRFFFECLAQETSASVFKNNPQLLQENAPPPPPPLQTCTASQEPWKPSAGKRQHHCVEFVVGSLPSFQDVFNSDFPLSLKTTFPNSCPSRNGRRRNC